MQRAPEYNIDLVFEGRLGVYNANVCDVMAAFVYITYIYTYDVMGFGNFCLKDDVAEVRPL